MIEAKTALKEVSFYLSIVILKYSYSSYELFENLKFVLVRNILVICGRMSIQILNACTVVKQFVVNEE